MGMEHRELSSRAQQAGCMRAVAVFCVEADGRLRRLRDESRSRRHEGGQEVFARSDRIVRGAWVWWRRRNERPWPSRMSRAEGERDPS